MCNDPAHSCFDSLVYTNEHDRRRIALLKQDIKILMEENEALRTLLTQQL